MRAITKKSLLLLAIGFILCGAFSPPAYSAPFHSKCWVPYNIFTGNWSTGLNITTDYTDEVLTIDFWGSGTRYATVYMTMSGRFWTGTPQQLLALLPSPPAFQSPSLILIYSEKGVFTVTQFVMNSTVSSMQGFGHQTFHSYPYGNGWPYTTADQPPL